MAGGVKDRSTSRRPKPAHLADRGSGMIVPTPINNGPVKSYQHPILEGNGAVPANPYKGVVSRTKKLPGPPSNLA